MPNLQALACFLLPTWLTLILATVVAHVMMNAGTLEANVEAISMLCAAQTVDDLVVAGSHWAKATGFDHWAYGIREPARPLLIGNFPDSWTIAVCSASPIDADRSRRAVVWNLDSQDRQVAFNMRGQPLHEECGCGLRAGITVPVHSPDGGLNCTFAASNTRAVDPVTQRQQEPLVVAFSIYFQRAIARVMGEQIFAPRHPTLVTRELECLQWSAHAKTSDEIALILGISRSTVNFHLSNASRKLGVKGRQQAVQQAARMNLIES